MPSSAEGRLGDYLEWRDAAESSIAGFFYLGSHRVPRMLWWFWLAFRIPQPHKQSNHPALDVDVRLMLLAKARNPIRQFKASRFNAFNNHGSSVSTASQSFRTASNI